MKTTLIKGGLIVTMNAKFDCLKGDLLIRGERIAEIGPDLALSVEPETEILPAEGCFVIPGLIQAHTHLCQTLFRGMADDLELLDWLRERIWPMESAHNEESIRASARLGLLEMQLLGTTAILDMGTVRLHEAVFDEAKRFGMRYWGGNCLMDKKSNSGPLFRPTEETIAYSEELIRDWHHRTPLLQYAISPRFALSCTGRMLKEAVRLRAKHDLIFHTHASENRAEIRLVRAQTGMENIAYLDKTGCLTNKTVIAHGIHMSPGEVKRILKSKTGVCHCPSSNLKLASGIARIHEYKQLGMKLALGADGAPCNNTLDPFMEMRLAALLQKPLSGPTALKARDALELATRGGAGVLNAEDSIGSLEPGKCADVVVVDRSHPSVATVEDPYSALVYSCSGRDVRDVFIAGRPVVRGHRHKIFDAAEVTRGAAATLEDLKSRLTKIKRKPLNHAPGGPV